MTDPVERAAPTPRAVRGGDSPPSERPPLALLAEGVLRLDALGRCCYASPGAHALLGADPSALLGTRLFDAFQTPLGEALRDAAERVGALGEAAVVEGYDARCGRALHCRLVPWEPAGVLVLITERTAPRTDADVPTQDEVRFRALSRSAARAVWWTGPAGAALGARAPLDDAATIAAPTDIATWAELAHPDEREQLRRAWDGALATGEAFSVAHRTRAGGASWLDVVTHGVPLRGAGGGVREWIFAQCEAPVPGEAAARLRESEAQLAEAQRIAAIGSWTWDIPRNRAAWSDGLRRIFGLTAASSRSGDPGEFYGRIHPADRRTLREYLVAGWRRQATTLEFECRIVRPDDEVRRLVSRAEVIYNQHGRAAAMAGTSQDVTEQRSLEAQYRQAQKMEAVGQLAGGIAHDFNNLLTAIGTNAELALDALRDAGAAVASHVRTDVGTDLREIQRAAGRAAELTRQLLAFSRRQMLDPAAVDLNGVVSGAMPMLRRLVSENIRIDTVLATTLGTVVVDARQLEQVLMNLVVNARDAVREVPSPRITVATLDVVVHREGDWGTEQPGSGVRGSLLPAGADPVRLGLAPGRYAVLAVRDNGIGIDPETQRRVFEPFFTTKPVGEGTGLGLATVYGIVKQSGGYVYVDSVPEGGALFSVYLPLARGGRASPGVAHAAVPGADVDAAPPTAPAPPAGRKRSVLVVEDEPPVRFALKRLLERDGMHVIEAQHGAHALALWQARRDEIGLVMTDVVMPELGGIALAERLRAERPDLPVVFISGYSEPATAIDHLAGPPIPWIAKPFDAAAVARLAGGLLAGSGAAGG